MTNPFGPSPATADDLPELEALDSACASVDGAAAVPEPPLTEIISSYPTLRATRDGRVVAAGWLSVADGTAVLRGKVHPDVRRQGAGSALLKGLEDLAQELGSRDFVIRNEAFGLAAEVLYRRHGYACDFIEAKMERELRVPLPNVPTPSFERWTTDNQVDFHSAYLDSFRERPGFKVNEATQWIGEHTADGSFRADLSLLVKIDGQPAGFISTFVDAANPSRAYIGQVGTSPTARRRGLGTALIIAVMTLLRQEAVAVADLHVNENNPRAIELYERLGFLKIGRRAKYSRPMAIHLRKS
jgi:ribosomal protein S18 acetylase RimI-like enzyme